MYVCMYIFRTRNMSDSIKMIKLCDQNLKFHFWYTLPDTFDLNARLLWYQDFHCVIVFLCKKDFAHFVHSVKLRK